MRWWTALALAALGALAWADLRGIVTRIDQRVDPGSGWRLAMTEARLDIERRIGAIEALVHQLQEQGNGR